jgi:hypothetical protein
MEARTKEGNIPERLEGAGKPGPDCKSEGPEQDANEREQDARERKQLLRMRPGGEGGRDDAHPV